MNNIHSLLILLAFLSAVFAALGVPSSRVNLIGAALAFYFLSMLLP